VTSTIRTGCPGTGGGTWTLAPVESWMDRIVAPCLPMTSPTSASGTSTWSLACPAATASATLAAPASRGPADEAEPEADSEAPEEDGTACDAEEAPPPPAAPPALSWTSLSMCALAASSDSWVDALRWTDRRVCPGVNSDSFWIWTRHRVRACRAAMASPPLPMMSPTTLCGTRISSSIASGSSPIRDRCEPPGPPPPGPCAPMSCATDAGRYVDAEREDRR
jgi:hypothetical protein